MTPEKVQLDVRVHAGHRWQIRSRKRRWIQAVSVSAWPSHWIMIYSDPSDFLELDKEIRSNIPTLPRLSESDLKLASRADAIAFYLQTALSSAPNATRRFLDVHNLARYVHDGNESALAFFDNDIGTWRDAADGTLLHYAAGCGKCVRTVANRCPASLRDNYGLQPAHVAAMCGNVALARKFDEYIEPGRSVLSKFSVPLQYRVGNHERFVLIIVNPISGKGHAMQVFQDVIAPILDATGIKYELNQTTRLGDATEIALTFDARRFHTIMCVSGDGILHEVLQGLSQRKESGESFAFQRFPVVVIPAGSGNGVVCSQSGPSASPLDGMKKFLRGCYLPADLMEVLPIGTSQSAAANNSIFAIVSVAWGLLSDVDFDSEPLRFLGGLRFTLIAVLRLLLKKKYLCEIRYRNSPSEEFQCVKGHLDFFIATNIAFLTPDTLIAPSAKIDDGKIHICLSQDQSRVSMLSMLACDVESGQHVKRSGVVSVTCTELIIEPISKTSLLDVDGERCYHNGVHCIIRPTSASLIA